LAASRFGAASRSGARSAALEPVEAVEDEVERELELDVVIAAPKGASVGDREGHLRDVRKRGAKLAGDAGGRLRLEVSGKIAIVV
jgi:hypothetical protein